ncbi:unnamed protein product [Lampetra fluviatilis]
MLPTSREAEVNVSVRHMYLYSREVRGVVARLRAECGSLSVHAVALAHTQGQIIRATGPNSDRQGLWPHHIVRATGPTKEIVRASGPLTDLQGFGSNSSRRRQQEAFRHPEGRGTPRCQGASPDRTRAYEPSSLAVSPRRGASPAAHEGTSPAPVPCRHAEVHRLTAPTIIVRGQPRAESAAADHRNRDKEGPSPKVVRTHNFPHQ